MREKRILPWELIRRSKQLTVLPLLFLILFVAYIPRFRVLTFETSSIQVVVSRYLDKNVVYPKGVFTVQLICSMVGNITGVIIKERIPIGFRFVNSTSSPPQIARKFNATINEVNWLFINIQGVKDVTINYTVEVAVDANKGTHVFEGDWKAVGYERKASGSSSATEILVEKTEKPLFGPEVSVYAILLLTVAVAMIVAFMCVGRNSWNRISKKREVVS